MSVEALIKLRDDIGKILNQRAVQLQSQLSRLAARSAAAADEAP
jgi:hypothetical protein